MAERFFTIEQCVHIYNITPEFLEEIINSGLLSFNQTEEGKFLKEDDFFILEEISRWHNELEINVPGIEALYYMREKMNDLQKQNQSLKNDLSFFRLRFPQNDFFEEYD